MKMIRIKDEDFVVNQQFKTQKLLEQVDGLIYQFQYFPDKKKASFPFASNGLWSIYEVTPESVRYDATPALIRIHKDDIEAVYDAMFLSMNTLTNWNCDYRVVLPSKGVRWLRGSGRPEKLEDGSFLWNGYITDITERKKMEIDLFESKQRLQFAIENSRDGVWDWNVKTNEVFYSNESKEILGFLPHEIENTSEAWDDRVHPDDKKEYYGGIKKHFMGEMPYYSGEYRIQCKDGNYKWILDRGKVIERDKKGRALRVIGTHSDITLQKKREEEARKTIKTIEEQNDRLLNFAHIVSHNLGSHSGNFQMLIEMIDETNDLDEKIEMISHLKKVSGALSDTILHLNEVVSVQTNGKKRLKRINLNEYVKKTIDILIGNIDKYKATIKNQIPTDIFIEYNTAYMDSILLNLMSNTLKYKHPDRNPEIEIEAFYQEESLVLEVSDNGMGIDLDKFGDKLFGMYKTFHGNEDANGIGLFITKNQVESMGGKIEVESQENVGTVFRIIFN